MSTHSPDDPSPRRRLSRDERQRQLLEVAWRLVREEGTEALTLGRLAEQAGVTKPVVYDHFGTRARLLAALYQDYDLRQTALMEAALEASEATLEGRADVIARAYVDCVMQQGREIPGWSRPSPARRSWSGSSATTRFSSWTSAAPCWSPSPAADG